MEGLTNILLRAPGCGRRQTANTSGEHRRIAASVRRIMIRPGDHRVYPGGGKRSVHFSQPLTAPAGGEGYGAIYGKVVAAMQAINVAVLKPKLRRRPSESSLFFES